MLRKSVERHRPHLVHAKVVPAAEQAASEVYIRPLLSHNPAMARGVQGQRHQTQDGRAHPA